tara:strand:+ start:287 stop:547 length:261 start_codon:yes stop_codon:yes gene_type:complete
MTTQDLAAQRVSLINFTNETSNLEAFEKDLNLQLRKVDSNSDDLLSGRDLKNQEVEPMSRDAFRSEIKSQDKFRWEKQSTLPFKRP